MSKHRNICQMIRRRVLPCMVLLKKKTMLQKAVLHLVNIHSYRLDLNSIQYKFLPVNTKLWQLMYQGIMRYFKVLYWKSFFQNLTLCENNMNLHIFWKACYKHSIKFSLAKFSWKYLSIWITNNVYRSSKSWLHQNW